MKYDHKKIEAKWQKYWQDNKTFKAIEEPSKPKYYVLDMFPYPSGSGLHVGHVVGYTATDILARYKRQKGYSVLHPMGWDSFGLPAEQYAVRTGQHPAVTTQHNINTFRKQLKSLGYSYDWEREFATSDPSYYKWTQWIFTKLYEKGLAYEAEMLVNYCPALGTVLANEEVENGRSKEGNHPIERKPLKQWMLKITAYAERLLEDLDLLDWSDSLKKLQTNWIGKSEGAQIDFNVKGSNLVLTVFTTRPDTLFGATNMVLAPEHPFVDKIVSAEQRPIVENYQKQVATKSDLERTDLNKNKSGVFTGGYAINPANGQEMPIWISDYIIMGYGTGAIMSVPTHDERDFEFAKQYGLPVVPVIDPDFTTAQELIQEGENPDNVRQEILQGNRCWTGEGKYINSSNKEISLHGLDIQGAKKAITTWLEKVGKGKATTHYKLRDWLFSRQRYWGEPFPVLHLSDGTIRTLDINELPLTLPEIADYKPTGDGKSPLAKATQWIETTDPKTGMKARRETNTMPNWAGSCWYYLRFCDPHNESKAWEENIEKYWMPVDMYVGGVEHAVLHLLYARFWHKVLYDCGFVSTLEPFKTLRNQGLIVARSYQNSAGAYVAPDDVEEKEGIYYHRKTGEVLKSQIEKMSKSKLNGVTPDDIIEEYGADALRLYEMFLGPLEKEKVWNTDAVTGCRRFLNRLFDMVTSDKVTDETTPEALKLGYKLVDGATRDIEGLLFNTAIAKMMEFVNDFSKLTTYPKVVLRMAVQVLSPFAPHIAEEMWQILGSKGELAYCPYPAIDHKILEEETATYIIQVNGKVRGKFELPKNQSQDIVLKAALNIPAVAKFLNGSAVEKIIFVPNKILNLVIK